LELKALFEWKTSQLVLLISALIYSVPFETTLPIVSVPLFRERPNGGWTWDTFQWQERKVDLLYFSCSRVIISGVHKNLSTPQNIIYLHEVPQVSYIYCTAPLENVPPDAQWSFGIYALHLY
jgi:hypothetical protein